MTLPINAVLPQVLHLWPNYPNPFNSATAIRFDLPQPTAVELAIFNLVGQRVAVLVNEELATGAHQITWDGRDKAGRELTSGMYIYRLQTQGQNRMQKLLLLR